MSFEDFQTKKNVCVVYTGDGKGKTSASVGLMARALGTEWKVAYIQFIKHWNVGEHDFIAKIQDVFGDKLYFYKGGKGFYDADHLSAKDVSEDEHKQAALKTYEQAIKCVQDESFDLVICDEINNAVNDGLLTQKHLEDLMKAAKDKVSLCLTGRNFPEKLVKYTDIATNMTKIRHHFDDKYLANKGIDY